MDLDARILRRQRQDDEPRLIQDYEALSPVAHIDEPSDRGPVFERLLDHLDPVFDGRLPPNAYVYGPFGAGKSAIVTALFSHMERLATGTESIIYTSTRAGSTSTPGFVYVDMRETTSEFAFYHGVLDALVEESVPKHGISTTDLRSRLHTVLGKSPEGIVIGVDHVGEPNAPETDTLVDLFAGLPSNVSWVAIGREHPDDISVTEYTARSIHVEPYQRQMMVDVLMTRASAALTRQALSHDLARQIADWAGGNAHDALSALFIAADRAHRGDRNQVLESDLTSALAGISRPSVSLGRVLVLPENKQTVLRVLVDLDPDKYDSVTETTDAISSHPDVSLTPGTIKRFLYELAEEGIVDRVPLEADTAGKGRPPSRIELRFPAPVFKQLYDFHA